jgi:hypothetical protein
VLLIGLAARASASAGLVAERRCSGARTLARRALQTVRYLLVPFVSYVSIARLQITV